MRWLRFLRIGGMRVDRFKNDEPTLATKTTAWRGWGTRILRTGLAGPEFNSLSIAVARKAEYAMAANPVPGWGSRCPLWGISGDFHALYNSKLKRSCGADSS